MPKQETAKQVMLTFPVRTQRLDVTLRSQTELTYGDVLRLAHEQNPKLFKGYSFDRVLLRDNGFGASPLALPELLQRKRKFEAKGTIIEQTVPDQLLMSLADLYLF